MRRGKWKKAAALMLSVWLLIQMLPLQALAEYQANSWGGGIYWTDHGALMGHYATLYPEERTYSRGILCLEPLKSAFDWDYSYGDVVAYGSNPYLARIGYLCKIYANDKNYVYDYLATWAIGTGLAYDVVEGRAPAWGDVIDTITQDIPLRYYRSARNWIVEQLENFTTLPSGLYETAAKAKEHPLKMEKQADGSFRAVMPASDFWKTDVLYHGFKETEGTSGSFSLSGASVSWSRSEGQVTFTVTAQEAQKWGGNGGKSEVLELTKRIGNGESDLYPIWDPAVENDQDMLYVQEAVAANPKGYLVLEAEVTPAKVYFTKIISQDQSLVELCPQYYSLDGTEITVYRMDGSAAATLTVQNGKTQTVELMPGTYYAQETKAAPGFILDTSAVGPFTLSSGQTYTAELKNRPKFDPVTTLVYKEGLVDGKLAPLEGCEFTVSYFTEDNLSLSAAKSLAAEGKAVRTWVFRSDAQGFINFAPKYLVQGELFLDKNGVPVGLPGTYLFAESTAPEGFEACNPFVRHVKIGQITETGEAQLNQRNVRDENLYGYCYVTKEIGDNEDLVAICPDFYSLDGAEFTIYYKDGTEAKDRNGDNAVLTIENGQTSTLCLAAGTYIIRETKAPDHFYLDPEAKTFSITENDTENDPLVLSFKDSPKFDSLSLMFLKTATIGGVEDQPLEGAVVKVDYCPSLNSEENEIYRTWYFVSDAEGKIGYENAYLAEGYDSDPLFVSEEGTLVGLPGTYFVEEILAPIGYTLVDGFSVILDPDAENFGTETSAWNVVTIKDDPQSIFLQISKVNEDGDPVPPAYGTYEGAVFNVMGFDLVHNEYKILGTITTDAEGKGRFRIPNPVSDRGPFYTTYFVQEIQASPGCVVNPTIFPVNPGISAVNIPEIVHCQDVVEGQITVSIYKTGMDDAGLEIGLAGAVLELREEDQTTVVHTWESTGEIEIFDGLPKGTYYIYEIQAPEGYFPLTEPVEINVEETETIQNFKVRNDRFPKLQTKAMFSTGSQMGIAGEGMKVEDVVEVKYLVHGEEYVLEASLINKEDGTVAATGTTTFIAEGWMEEQSVFMTFDGTDLEGQTFYVSEYLYQPSRSLEEAVGSHDDETDVDQSLFLTEIKTTAYDGADDDKIVSGAGTQTIRDKVEYHNLIADGRAYTVTGILMNAETGKAVLDADGNNLSSRVTFIPEERDGTVWVSIEIPVDRLPLKTVVFEKVYEGEVLIAVHDDLEDEGQTIYSPSIGTQAMDMATGERMAAMGEIITLQDVIAYENLAPDTTYRITTTLMVKSTGEPLVIDGKTITQETVVITPKAEEGEVVVSGTFVVRIEFPYDEKLSGDALVVFESVKAEATGIVEAVHEDIEDEGQTVSVPSIKTTALTENGTHRWDSGAETVTITDTIEYHGLVAGKTYHVYTALINGSTGEPLVNEKNEEITAELLFTAPASEGEVKVTLTAPIHEDLASIVVFEDVFLVAEEKVKNERDEEETVTKEYLVGQHHDLSDKDQTVAKGPDTGDILGLGFFLISMVISLAVLCVLRKRKKMADREE